MIVRGSLSGSGFIHGCLLEQFFQLLMKGLSLSRLFPLRHRDPDEPRVRRQTIQDAKYLPHHIFGWISSTEPAELLLRRGLCGRDGSLFSSHLRFMEQSDQTCEITGRKPLSPVYFVFSRIRATMFLFQGLSPS